MADKSDIEWTDATWNPITGCSVVSPGCTNCYAMKLAGTRLQHHPSRAGLTTMSKAGPVWNGQVRLNEEWLLQPLHWKAARRIFVCAHGDLFHESVPDEWIDRVFAVMALAPQHTFQVLTKRSKRMREYLSGLTVDRIELAMDDLSLTDAQAHGIVKVATTTVLPNVWIGVSTEDQQRANERIPDLLAAPAAVRFISAEPLLGAIDLTKVFDHANEHSINALIGRRYYAPQDDEGEVIPRLDGVIVGGESGPRPMHPDWARSLRDQCAAAGVPFFFKQWGEWEVAIDRDREDPDWRRDYRNEFGDTGKTKWLNLNGGCGFHGDRFHVMRRVGKARAGRLLDGVEHNGMPEVRRG